RIARHWTNFAHTLDPGPGWRPYRPTSAPGGNNIEILSSGRAATGALAVPADPVAASNCTPLWATPPPFPGSFPTEVAASGPGAEPSPTVARPQRPYVRGSSSICQRRAAASGAAFCVTTQALPAASGTRGGPREESNAAEASAEVRCTATTNIGSP